MTAQNSMHISKGYPSGHLVNSVCFPADHIAQAPSLTPHCASATLHKWVRKGGGDV